MIGHAQNLSGQTENCLLVKVSSPLSTTGLSHQETWWKGSMLMIQTTHATHSHTAVQLACVSMYWRIEPLLARNCFCCSFSLSNYFITHQVVALSTQDGYNDRVGMAYHFAGKQLHLAQCTNHSSLRLTTFSYFHPLKKLSILDSLCM